VPNPHWSAWMLPECLLERVELAGLGQALDGSHLGAVCLTASIKQARTALASTSTVQAPHTPCSQPIWAP